MEDEIKNVWEVLINLLTLAGAGVAFYFSLHQWRCGHAFQKAQKLDEFIERFESDEMLRLAATVLDWRERMFPLRGREVKITSKEVLLALRLHQDIRERPMFPGDRMLFRDAYDALLNFLQRLEIAISGNLVDPSHAKKCFQYWMERLLSFDRHQDDSENPFLGGITPAAMVLAYIEQYGDIASFRRLCEAFEMQCNLPGAGSQSRPHQTRSASSGLG